ncbi:MAG: Uma2 family endonuclease [Firmicutes bacterium]|nr:Uma2 family endonuclease [Bacillota bacterium]
MPLLQQAEIFTVSDIYTTDYIYALPEGERAELINGHIYNMAPPSTRHQLILGNMHTDINNHIRANNGSCKAFPAPFAVFIKDDEKNYVEPDISIICDGSKLDDRGCHGAPDWIIEIASPSNAGYDYVEKLALYSQSGVREYWIVDPMQESTTVYYLENGFNPSVFNFYKDIPSGVFKDFNINISKLLKL